MVNTDRRCMRCLYGNIVNGVCTRCRQPEQTPDMRKSNALPLHYVLHGRYHIGGVLGNGGFGITYAAWDTQTNSRVAVKEFFPNRDMVRITDRCTARPVEGQEEYIRHASQCFINEANLLMTLQGQEGVVSLYNLFSDNGTFYYAMEYLEGMNLSEYLMKNGKMAWNQLAPLLVPVLRAMAMLHRSNLIHRDISPDNIFLTGNGQARLIDFGSVRTYQDTKSFTTFMKHNFAPWEQYQTHGDQGPWTDIYALCVTIYYCLTGVLPPRAPDRRLNDTTQPLTALCPQLPQNIAAAVHKGMAVNIPDRYADVQQLAQALGLQSPAPVPPRQQVCLVCAGGYFQGRQWQMTANTQLRIGRRPHCEIQYPANMVLISGSHCEVMVDGSGEVLVRDDNSRNGTWLDSIPLQGGMWYRARRGSRIRFAQEDYLIQ